MGSGCNARLLSYMAAGLHLVGSILALVGFVIYTRRVYSSEKDTNVNSSRNLRSNTMELWFFLPLLVIYKSGILIKGIMQKRAKSIAGFLLVMALIICIFIIGIIVEFVIALVQEQPFGSAITEFLMYCGIIGVELVILSPVLVFYNQLNKSRDNESDCGMSYSTSSNNSSCFPDSV